MKGVCGCLRNEAASQIVVLLSMLLRLLPEGRCWKRVCAGWVGGPWCRESSFSKVYWRCLWLWGGCWCWRWGRSPPHICRSSSRHASSHITASGGSRDAGERSVADRKGCGEEWHIWWNSSTKDWLCHLIWHSHTLQRPNDVFTSYYVVTFPWYAAFKWWQPFKSVPNSAIIAYDSTSSGLSENPLRPVLVKNGKWLPCQYHKSGLDSRGRISASIATCHQDVTLPLQQCSAVYKKNTNYHNALGPPGGPNRCHISNNGQQTGRTDCGSLFFSVTSATFQRKWPPCELAMLHSNWQQLSPT